MKKVSQVMHRNPKCAELDTPIPHIAQWMKDLDCGAIPVQDKNGKLMGIITDRDLTIRVLTHYNDPQQVKAKEVMSKQPLYCTPEDDLASACKKMAEKQIRRLPVLDKNNAVIGILSLGDVALAEKGLEEGLCFHTLEQISEHH